MGERTLKILWHSNAPFVSTGYGQQTALFTPLVAAKHDVRISAFYGLDGNRLNVGGITVYPGIQGTYGSETITGHAEDFFGDPKDGLIMTLMDVWVLDEPTMEKLNILAWAPVDHDPAPPGVLKFFEDTNARPLAMSRFGQSRLEKFNPLYCPHGVDTKIFSPIPQAEARRRAGMPQEAFVVGIVAANKGNPSRKSFPEALRAYAAFASRHDDVVLYLHTDMVGGSGVHLAPLMENLKIKNAFITDQHRYRFNPLSPRTMAAAYSSMDVLLSPSTGEGFGIPILEAQACGTPAIVTDFSAMSEVCGSGWRVGGDPIWTSQMSWQMRPNVEELVESLEAAHRRPRAKVKADSDLALEHAAQYEVGKVFKEYMLPAINETAEQFKLKPPELVTA